MSDVFLLTFDAPPFDEREALRYAAVRGNWENALPQSCYDELAPLLSFHACCREYPVLRTGKGLDLGFAVTASRDLAKALEGCDSVVVFAATVGFGPDRLVHRYERLSPARALLFQAIGAERIEALCDAVSGRISARYRQQGRETTPRFSPGYGDLPLALQQPLLTALGAEKSCGITLTEGYLMLPTKSVTALIGLRPAGEAKDQTEQGSCERKTKKCAVCGKTDCAFRR